MEGCGAALLVRRLMERRADSISADSSPSHSQSPSSSPRSSPAACWSSLLPVLDGGLDRMVRSSGLLLATIGVVGTLWCVGLHFVAVLPHFVGHRPLESLAGLCHLAFSVFLAHGGFYNYFKVLLSHLFIY